MTSKRRRPNEFAAPSLGSDSKSFATDNEIYEITYGVFSFSKNLKPKLESVSLQCAG